MSVNEIQIGGDHYKTEYQHWDFCIDNKVNFLEANATAYLLRWRKKNGLEDLKKVGHYIEKIHSAYLDSKYPVPTEYCNSGALFDRLIKAYQLQTPQEHSLLSLLFFWKNSAHLGQAQVILARIILEEELLAAAK